MDSSGLYFNHQQEIGQGFNINCAAAGVPSISPDGSKFARFENSCGLELFEFDRCNGILYNPQFLALDSILYPGAGSAFSPNSRFLYISSNTSIYQIDTWTQPLQLLEVAHYDGFMDPFSTTFLMLDLQPDGRIYINSSSSVKSMHVIEYPDSLGAACNVKQHSVKLNTLNYLTIPKTPNHLLGVLEGSPCDKSSMSTKLPIKSLKFNLYPNPIHNEECIIELNSGLSHAQDYEVMITNIYGMQIYKSSIPAYSYIHRMNLADLPSGVYFCNIIQNGQVLATQKLVVVD